MKHEITDPCPQCGEQLEFDEVDIGVGTLRGNPGCPSCGWTPRAMDEIEEPSDEEIYDEEKYESEK